MPHPCGIATYTYDLATAAFPRQIVAVQPPDGPATYPAEVRHRIRRDELEDYYKIAEALNDGVVDVGRALGEASGPGREVHDRPVVGAGALDLAVLGGRGHERRVVEVVAAHGDASADLDADTHAHTHADSPRAADDRLACVRLAAQPGTPGGIADAARRHERQRNDHGDRDGP